MLRINQCKIDIRYEEQELKRKICHILKINEKQLIDFKIVKESLDARKKPALFYILTIDVNVKDENKVLSNIKKEDVRKVENAPYELKITGSLTLKNKPVVIGAGPCGLVCAYYLAKAGYKPIVIERGKAVEDRQKDVDLFWKDGILNEESNVQFGEGGAGTFSDGKLNTLIKDKNGRCHEILSLFVKMGAPSDIIYKKNPHVGTDLLAGMVKNLRQSIINYGGEVYFDTRLEDIQVKNGKVESITLSNKETIYTDILVLAVGHSARDTFKMLSLKNEFSLKPKAFAVGFRVQHPQEMINRCQYGMQSEDIYEKLGAANYKLTAKAGNDRGVYTFCMCPGGYVVNASSKNGYLCVNGMSYHARDSKTANSAVIITVDPSDFGPSDVLSGVYFQEKMEKKAFELCRGKVPVQFYTDFKNNQKSDSQKVNDWPNMAIKGDFKSADLRKIYPDDINEAFIDGMSQFSHKIKGFDGENCMLAGIESRTSSPIRMERDENGVAVSNNPENGSIIGCYPCGEGAGYAGGITSAAMDGLYIAECIMGKYSPLQ